MIAKKYIEVIDEFLEINILPRLNHEEWEI